MSLYFQVRFYITATSRLPPAKTVYHKDHGFIDHDTFVHSFHYSSLASLTGVPSISMCIGHDQDTNLPICVQLISKWWMEDILFLTAKYIEEEFRLTKTPNDFQNVCY